jgi:hypothetical protein
MDLCYKIVDAVKAQLKMPDLKVALQPVTSATRIPLIANGTVDMECGSTTNNLERQQQVSFVVTTFVTANRLMSKAKNKVVNLEDLKGKTLVSTSGTSNLKQVTELNGTKNLAINIVTAADHPAAFRWSKAIARQRSRWTTSCSIVWWPNRKSRRLLYLDGAAFDGAVRNHRARATPTSRRSPTAPSSRS